VLPPGFAERRATAVDRGSPRDEEAAEAQVAGRAAREEGTAPVHVKVQKSDEGLERLSQQPPQGADPEETGDALVGQRIKVHWPLDEAWYVAVVTGYSHETKQHEVRYVDDDVVEALDLDEEEWRLDEEVWRLDGRGASARGAAKATKEMAEAGSKGVTTASKGSISGSGAAVSMAASASTSEGDPSAAELTADCPRKRLRPAEAMATPVKAPGDEETGATLESPAAQMPRNALSTALVTTAMPSADAT